MVYTYDALSRGVRAEPVYARPQPRRVQVQTWSFDALGSMQTWNDTTGLLYGWSVGSIVNGLQMPSDSGLGPLPVSSDS